MMTSDSKESVLSTFQTLKSFNCNAMGFNEFSSSNIIYQSNIDDLCIGNCKEVCSDAVQDSKATDCHTNIQSQFIQGKIPCKFEEGNDVIPVAIKSENVAEAQPVSLKDITRYIKKEDIDIKNESLLNSNWVKVDDNNLTKIRFENGQPIEHLCMFQLRGDTPANQQGNKITANIHSPHVNVGFGITGGTEKKHKENSQFNRLRNARHKPVSKSRVHKSLPPYTCAHCMKSFTQKGHLNEHLRIHEGIKPWKCKYCNKFFTAKGGLNRHLKRHERIFSFECNYCQKAFIQKGLLRDHINMHLGICPYKCNYCNKDFRQRHILIEHLKMHEQVPFCEWDKCHKLFKRKGDLGRHLIVHEGIRPYKCEHCSKSFVCKGSLTEHLKMHEGIRPHECKYCHKSFSQKRHFVVHLRIHEGVRPYECSHCNKTFVRKGHVIGHINRCKIFRLIKNNY